MPGDRQACKPEQSFQSVSLPGSKRIRADAINRGIPFISGNRVNSADSGIGFWHRTSAERRREIAGGGPRRGLLKPIRHLNSCDQLSIGPWKQRHGIGIRAG